MATVPGPAPEYLSWRTASGATATIRIWERSRAGLLIEHPDGFTEHRDDAPRGSYPSSPDEVRAFHYRAPVPAHHT